MEMEGVPEVLQGAVVVELVGSAAAMAMPAKKADLGPRHLTGELPIFQELRETRLLANVLVGIVLDEVEDTMVLWDQGPIQDDVEAKALQVHAPGLHQR